MAELIYPNVAGSYQQGLGYGRQLRAQDMAQQNQSRLSELAARAYGASPDERGSLIQQAIGVDPQAGFALNEQLSGQDQAREAKLLRTAKLLASAPDEYKPALYRQIYPQVSQDLPGLPPEWTPDVGQGIEAFIASREAATAAPTGFRELDMKARAAGLRPGSPEYQQAMNIALGREGRAATGGFGFEEVVGPDGRKRVQRRNPRTGQVEVYDESTGEFIPMGGAGSLGVMAPASGPAINIEGIPQARQQQIAQAVASLRALNVPDDQIDVFVQQQAYGQPQFVAPSGGGAPRSAILGAGPTEAETEAAKTAARQQAEIGFMPQRGRIESQIEGEKAAARQAAETAAERGKTAIAKAPQLQNVERGLNRIDKALAALERGTVGDTGPVDQYYQQFTKEGQELEGAVGAIQNDMLALTRVPGVGSQSDLEAKVAALKYPSLGNHPDVNRRNVQQLRAFIADLAESLGRGAPATGTRQQERPALPPGFSWED